MSRGFIITLSTVLAASMILFHFAIKKPPDDRFVSAMAGMRATATEWVGAYPPDLELEILDGGVFRLSDVVGDKVLILNFFATWCRPCRAEIPELERYAALHRDDVLLLGIDVKEDGADVRRFVLQRGMTYPIALDKDGRAAALYEAGVLPTTVVVGLDGRVLLHEVGAISNAEIAFDALLKHQMEVAQRIAPITPEGFRRKSAAAGHPSGKIPEAASMAALDGRSLELAKRIRCPSCGKSILRCKGKTARKLRRRLAELDLNGMTDAEVLATLFLLPEDES